ncbi:MAG: SIS domain-containing protein [Synergistaceae bacterium]|nr:SIS domain-containing protein [Synergistaceae bacterium]
MSVNFDSNSIIDAAKRVVANEAIAVAAAADHIGESFVRVVRLLSACTGKALVTGSGTSGAIAARAAHLLSVGGMPSFHLPPGDGLHGGLGALRENDVIIAISKGGNSAELNEFCTRGRKLCAALVAVTADENSPLAKLADHVLLVKSAPEADLGTVIATGSSIAAGALLDALVEACRITKGYEWESFFFTHPGGTVGKYASTTLDMLRKPGRDEK